MNVSLDGVHAASDNERQTSGMTNHVGSYLRNVTSDRRDSMTTSTIPAASTRMPVLFGDAIAVARSTSRSGAPPLLGLRLVAAAHFGRAHLVSPGELDALQPTLESGSAERGHSPNWARSAEGGLSSCLHRLTAATRPLERPGQRRG